MKTDVFDSINKLKEVFAESKNAALFTVIPEKVSEKVQNIAKSARDKMIEILNQFYEEHYQSSEGIDEFVTLFGGETNEQRI